MPTLNQVESNKIRFNDIEASLAHYWHTRAEGPFTSSARNAQARYLSGVAFLSGVRADHQSGRRRQEAMPRKKSNTSKEDSERQLEPAEETQRPDEVVPRETEAWGYSQTRPV